MRAALMAPPLVTFARPPSWAPPPGASPLLGTILLALHLCHDPRQLAAWWDWPAHREARWHLSPDEAATAAEAPQRRHAELQQAA